MIRGSLSECESEVSKRAPGQSLVEEQSNIVVTAEHEGRTDNVIEYVWESGRFMYQGSSSVSSNLAHVLRGCKSATIMQKEKTNDEFHFRFERCLENMASCTNCKTICCGKISPSVLRANCAFLEHHNTMMSGRSAVERHEMQNTSAAP